MAIRIALFNHKGGVSKTTTTFNLGWMLAELGHKVLLVDSDPQCNLSGLILGFQGMADFEAFYQEQPERNLRAGLTPAFESQPRQISPVDCVKVPGRENLWLLPGHIRLSEFDVTLGIAQELSGTIQTLKNLPGSFTFLFSATAKALGADIILTDMNPSLSSINQNLLMTSDYFVLPASPDYFSLMAIDSLLSVLPRWHAWADRARTLPALADAAYPFPDTTPRFLGTVIQNYRPRKGAPTIGFQNWINAINAIVTDRFVPALRGLGMALPPEAYARLHDFVPGYCLSLIPDFNTLIARSQERQTPIFALTDAQLGSIGVVLESDQRKRDEFRGVFDNLAQRVLALIDDVTGS